MGSFSLIHWIIVGIALLLLFGGNRFSSMMGDVAKGLKSFKAGMADDDEEQRVKSEQHLQQQGRIGGYDRPIDVQANPRAVDPVVPPVAATNVSPPPAPLSSTDGQAR